MHWCENDAAQWDSWGFSHSDQETSPWPLTALVAREKYVAKMLLEVVVFHQVALVTNRYSTTTVLHQNLVIFFVTSRLSQSPVFSREDLIYLQTLTNLKTWKSADHTGNKEHSSSKENLWLTAVTSVLQKAHFYFIGNWCAFPLCVTFFTVSQPLGE